jgi:hypothetical protein
MNLPIVHQAYSIIPSIYACWSSLFLFNTSIDVNVVVEMGDDFFFIYYFLVWLVIELHERNYISLENDFEELQYDDCEFSWYLQHLSPNVCKCYGLLFLIGPLHMIGAPSVPMIVLSPGVFCPNIMGQRNYGIGQSFWDRGSVWFDKDHKSKHHDGTCLIEIELHLQILITTLLSIVNKSGRTHVSTSKINKHAFLTTIIKAWEVQFSIQFFLKFNHRFVNATRFLLLKYNWYRLENMKKNQ